MNIEKNHLLLQDVLRSLLYNLSDDYMSLYELQQKSILYQTILENFDKVLKAAEEQKRVGTISGNEVLRLKSEYIELQTESLQNNYAIEQALGDIRKLLNFKENVRISTFSFALPTTTQLPNVGDLIAEALVTRPDYLLREKEAEIQKRNLRLQKSLAVPDIKFAYQPSDKGSNYVRTYSGFNIEMPLPFFNRNQGNIKSAKAQIKQGEAQVSIANNNVHNEVAVAYSKLILSQQALAQYDQDFLQKLDELRNNNDNNFNKRNISLLEFIDLQRIYIKTKTQQIELMSEYQRAINQINFSVGKEMLK
jgi:cobalt-zinc-cadmium efflux system outer membrane protein